MGRLHPIVLIVACAVGSMACEKPADAPAAPAKKADAPKKPQVKLLFAYGSEKKAWLKDAIARFNAGPGQQGAVQIVVEGKPVGSGAAIAEVVEGGLQPQVWSPASDVFRPLMNEAWAKGKGAAGGVREIAPEGKPLVLSPVVIAMWRPMAEALGWPGKPVGWGEVLERAKDPKGWASLGHPEWGQFKFGHTHPEYSNSGLAAVLAEAYAGAGVTRGLNADLLSAPKTRSYLEAIEGAVVHYGKSTGFFARKMLDRGPSFLSAAVLYENLVIESYTNPDYKDRALDVVAIYPREGTFWIDNPFLVMDAPWTTPAQKAAAVTLRDFLLSEAEQKNAMERYGFRPSDPSVGVTAPIDAAHGVDPTQPKTLLETPAPEVLRAALEAWRATKKVVDLVFVFDRSGSMQGEPLRQAKAGAEDFLQMLDPRDRVTILLFNDELPASLPAPAPVGESREALVKSIRDTFAGGGTALYGAIGQAHRSLEAAAAEHPGRIYAVVALTDGRDEHSKITVEALRQQLTPGAEMAHTIRVFTIAYGSGAQKDILKGISEAGGGAFFAGDTGNIRTVYRDLAAFF